MNQALAIPLPERRPANNTVLAVIPSWLAGRDLPEQAKRLYGLIEYYARQKGASFAGQEHFAERMGCSVRTIRRYLAALKQCGLVQVIQRGLRRTNLVEPVPSHPWMTAADGTANPVQMTLPIGGPSGVVSGQQQMSGQDRSNCPTNSEQGNNPEGSSSSDSERTEELAGQVWELAGAIWELQEMGRDNGFTNFHGWCRTMLTKPIAEVRAALAIYRDRIAAARRDVERQQADRRGPGAYDPAAAMPVAELTDADVEALLLFRPDLARLYRAGPPNDTCGERKCG